MGAPENYVEDYLRRQCKKRPDWICWKFEAPGNNGVPDRLVIGNGRHVFIETKSAVGRARKLQLYRIRQIRKAGGEALVANTREMIDAVIQAIETGKELPYD